jgi:hypothetical protein
MRRASLHQELGFGVVLWLLVGGAIGNPFLWIAGADRAGGGVGRDTAMTEP